MGKASAQMHSVLREWKNRPSTRQDTIICNLLEKSKNVLASSLRIMPVSTSRSWDPKRRLIDDVNDTDMPSLSTVDVWL
jgi:hypothetical protein